MKVRATAIAGARWMAWVGLLCGVVYAFGGLVYDLAMTGFTTGTALAFLALVGMPILFGAIGFVAGLLLALVAGVVGAARRRP